MGLLDSIPDDDVDALLELLAALLVEGLEREAAANESPEVPPLVP